MPKANSNIKASNKRSLSVTSAADTKVCAKLKFYKLTKKKL